MKEEGKLKKELILFLRFPLTVFCKIASKDMLNKSDVDSPLAKIRN